jgi:hypothetical protein
METETPISHPDLLWKDLFSEFHLEAVLFFFGKALYDAIDSGFEPEFLEQELNDVFTGNNPTKKIADKVIKYRLKNGNLRIIILHVEFQGEFDKDFAERMFWYFMYIAVKYKTTDITALAIYTDATKPKEYNCFKVSNFGTKMTYEFNTYIIRDQKEDALLAAESMFATAVLARLCLIKAGTDVGLKVAFKKRLAEIVFEKQFEQKKFFRLLNFVEQLIKLPVEFENEYKDFVAHISQPVNQQPMQAEKSFLLNYPTLFGKAVSEIQEDALEEGLEKGREQTIMNIRRRMGFSAEQIERLTGFTVEYIQSVIDKFEKK